MRLRQALVILGVLAAATAAAFLLLGTRARGAALGPADGADLPPTELNRVSVGTRAPDFRLRAIDGTTVALSDYEGEKDVVLVFYRGHW
jgi:cytochrome oxidase Cu insertion factor (SCO1/SenC/PrrC family)